MTVEFKRGPASTGYWSGDGSEPQMFINTSRKDIQLHSTIPSKGGGDTHCMMRIDSESFEWIVRNMLKADPESFKAIAGAMFSTDFTKANEAFNSARDAQIEWTKRRREQHRAWMAKRTGQAA